MKFIPVAAEKFEFLYIETAPLFDRDSGAQRADKEGVPLWEVRCLTRQLTAEGARPELLPVKIPSRRDLAEVLTPYQVVEFVDLVGFPWSIHDGRGNDGIAFSATGVSMVKPSANGSKPAKPADAAPVAS